MTAQIPLINGHPGVSSGVRGQMFGLGLHFHPYFACLNSEGSVESAHMYRLARSFVARRFNKYQKHMC